jgi:Putative MetA-pathway of phenol degradation
MGVRCALIGLAATLFEPGTALRAADDQPICPDRPGKGTGTCTVPARRWQIETGLIDWTHDHANGMRGDLTVIGSSLIKYGISDRADIELGLTPFEAFHLRRAGERATSSSFGDMLVRTKYRLNGNDAPIKIALDPFIKLPTARRHLGNDKVEAGITVPISVTLGKGPVSLALTPEIDWRADVDAHGYHTALSQVAGLGFASSSALSLSVELWRQWDWDPLRTVKQVSSDGSIAYLLSDSIQIDGGANFGLSRETPDIELYIGVSKLF